MTGAYGERGQIPGASDADRIKGGVVKPLKKCANGCDAPPKPPSLVICAKCMDGITETLEALVSGMRVTERAPKQRRTRE